MVGMSEDIRSLLKVEDDHTQASPAFSSFCLGFGQPWHEGKIIQSLPNCRPSLPTRDPVVPDMVILSLPHQLAQPPFTHKNTVILQVKL